MPGIQEIYSVNVSNRYDIGGDDEEASEDYDPLDTLKSLEDEKKRAAEEAKKKKQALANKARNQKKPVRFQESKDSNIPPKKEPNNNTQKSAKPPRQHTERNDGSFHGNNRRIGEGDENRRPPRRRNDRGDSKNDYGIVKGEGVEQSASGKTDQGFGRPAGNDYGPRKDRAERYRGSRGGFGGGRGQGRGYGSNRNDGRDDRGKREFDRRSGSDRTSVKPTEKRDGGGPRNWGTPGNEIEDSGEPMGTWQEQAEPEEQDVEKADKTGEEAVPEDSEPKVDEPTEMTLDEWRAKHESHSKPAFNIRKPGEGEDQDKWKNMKVLRKINSKSESKRDATLDDQQKKQSKLQVNVNIQFGDNALRGFGGRGRGRGERGRGRGRGGRFGGDRNQRQQYMPDVQNELEFPTLG